MSHPDRPDFRKEALEFFSQANSAEFGEMLLHPTQTLMEQQKYRTIDWLKFIEEAIQGNRMGPRAISSDIFAIHSSIVVNEVQEYRRNTPHGIPKDVPDTDILLHAAHRVFWSSLPPDAQEKVQSMASNFSTQPPSESDREMTLGFVLSCVEQQFAQYAIHSPLVQKIKHPKD